MSHAGRQTLDLPLDYDDEKKFLEAKFDGEVFLDGAGNINFFSRAGLSYAASVKLAKLAKAANGTII